jgi:hypothetical protein
MKVLEISGVENVDAVHRENGRLVIKPTGPVDLINLIVCIQSNQTAFLQINKSVIIFNDGEKDYTVVGKSYEDSLGGYKPLIFPTPKMAQEHIQKYTPGDNRYRVAFVGEVNTEERGSLMLPYNQAQGEGNDGKPIGDNDGDDGDVAGAEEAGVVSADGATAVRPEHIRPEDTPGANPAGGPSDGFGLPVENSSLKEND